MIRPTLPSIVAAVCLAGSPVVPGVGWGQEARTASAGHVVEVDVPAPALEGNLLGTPTTQRALVYLPPGYESDPARRYPTVYLLHGIFDEPEVWVRHFGVPEILDRLIAAGRIEPWILVMPTGGNRLGGGFYRNSPVSGDWGDFVVRDLVGRIDASFRTVAEPGARVVAGHSMGGYGAIHLAMERPGTFSVAYAMSPCCLAPVEDLGFGNTSWQETASLEEPGDLDRALEERRFWVVAAQAIAAAFLPDPEAPPLFVDVPFEVVRGETVLQQEEYARYLEQFPVARVDERRGELLELRGLAIDVGIGDQFLHIPVGARLLSEELAKWRVPHRLDLYTGDHREELAERLERVVFPWIADRLGG